MKPTPSRCPICGGEMHVTRLHCRECDSTIEGRFTSGPFANLTAEQFNFIETFIRCEGKINRMEPEIGLSYPTIRNRLHEVIRALGYEPLGDEPTQATEDVRRGVLEDLEQGRITYQEAMRLLQEGEST